MKRSGPAPSPSVARGCPDAKRHEPLQSQQGPERLFFVGVAGLSEIYALARDLARRGVVQIFASTDPLELAAVCNRVIVFYNSRICATLEADQLNAHTILEVMNTGKPPTPTATPREQTM